MDVASVRDVLAAIGRVCKVVPVDLAVHDCGLELRERYGFAVYDAMIVAAALHAGCRRLPTEVFQQRMSIDCRLRVENPFTHSPD